MTDMSREKRVIWLWCLQETPEMEMLFIHDLWGGINEAMGSNELT